MSRSSAPEPSGRHLPQPAVPRLVYVREVGRLGPRFVRLVLCGDDLAGFPVSDYTDAYIKLQLPPAGADYTSPFDVREICATRPREQWPRTRTYTVRAWDPWQELLTIDVLVHGTEGVAGPWAARAQVGDVAQILGPGGGYAPSADVCWHLMAGDLAAVPAIAASLERVPAEHVVHVLVQVDGPGDELELPGAADVRVRWIHDDGPEALVDAVRTLALPDGPGDAFVHGEASAVRHLRRHLLAERGLARHALSASGYWKRHRTDEGWREDKAAWLRQVEADLA